MRKLVSLLAAGAVVTAMAVVAATPSETPSVPTVEAAAVDYFLKLDGVKGESKDGRHKDEIEINSFSWGASQPGIVGGSSIGGSGGAGKVPVQDFHFLKGIDKSSPILMKMASNGQRIPQAVITVRKSGGDQQDFYKVTLQDVFVSSYQTNGSSGAVPADSFSLNFTKVEMSYIPVGADGKPEAPIVTTYDVKSNKK